MVGGSWTAVLLRLQRVTLLRVTLLSPERVTLS